MGLPKSRSSSVRVQRRQERTHARLTRAAAVLIAEHGVEGLRLRDVTAAADVGFGSFYSYFDSKEQLVNAVVVDLMASLARTLVARVSLLPDPAHAASAAHRWFVRNAHEDPRHARLIVHLDQADVLFQEMIMPYARRLLEAGIATGRFKDLDVTTTLTYVVGATLAVTRGVLEERLDSHAEVVSAEVLLGALGLAPAEAAEIARSDLPPFRWGAQRDED